MVAWEKLYDPDLVQDIVVGLSLHLDPQRLEQEGALCTDPPGVRVEGQHFFLCIETSGDTSKWVPLFTAANAGRLPLPKVGRAGHPKGVNGTVHYHTAQVWSASAQAVANAAARAHDKTRRGTRNTLATAHVPKV